MEIKREEIPYRILLLEKVTGIPSNSLVKMGNQEIIKLLRDYEKQLEEKAREENLTVSGRSEVDDPPTADQIKDAINLMYNYLRRHTSWIRIGGVTHYIVKEYPAFPLAIYIKDIRTTHWLGWWGVDRGEPYSKIFDVHRTPYYTFMDIGFEDLNRERKERPDYDYNEPYLWADRIYFEDGKIKYQITLRTHESSRSMWLMLGNRILLREITEDDLNRPISVEVNWNESFPSWRYTIRHSTRLAYFIYKIFRDYKKASGICSLFIRYGFTKDIYDCIFGVSKDYSLLYILDPRWVYTDCDIWDKLPRRSYLGYPYWSRVCYDRRLYMGACACADLCNLVYAIHALVVGYSPTSRIPDICKLVTGRPETTKVIDIADNLYRFYYTPCGMVYTTDLSRTLVSGIRTNLALILYTILAYRFNYTRYTEIADNLATRVYNAVIKSYRIRLADGSEVIRPQHYGGEMVSWKCGSEIQGFYEIPETWVDAIAQHMFGWRRMPPEDADYGITNMETTLTGLQALRVYLLWKYKIGYPNFSLLL